jgi:phosphatidylserine/phosphatidylglycerophosphate/cardiolipin synthase-like enzyme
MFTGDTMRRSFPLDLRLSRTRRRLGRLLLVVLLASGLSRPVAADVVRILHADQQSLQARVDLIQQARAEINVASYIVGDDEVPLILLALLRDAARRGLTVRLVVDGQGGNNQIPRAMQMHLIQEGVDLREFLPADRRLPGGQRMHDKLLIVDGEHLIAGGRNLKDHYFGLDCQNFVDRDVYVRGCAAAAAQCYYLDRWASADVGPPDFCRRLNRALPKEQQHYDLNDPGDECSLAEAAALLDEALASAEACGLVKLHTGQDWAAGQREVACVRFLHDQPGVSKSCPGGIGDRMLELLSQAQCCLVLQTPYFVISDELKQVLVELRCRDVEVILLTNSLQSTNHETAHAGYMNQRRWLLRLGIEIWELTGCDHLHAKAALIDGQIAVIGSYNFDMLSEQKNSEVAVAIDDEEIAAGLWSSMESHFARCNPIGPNGKPLGYQIRHPGASRDKLKEMRRKRLYASFIKRFL